MAVEVFVSSESITREPAAGLVRALRKRGLSVRHTPPWGAEESWDGPWNAEWDDWYGPNLRRAMMQSSRIVLVISPLWEQSSWMLAECEAARAAVQARQAGQAGQEEAQGKAQGDPQGEAQRAKPAKIFIFNPEGHEVSNLNFTFCVGNAVNLPSSPEAAAEEVSRSVSGINR